MSVSEIPPISVLAPPVSPPGAAAPPPAERDVAPEERGSDDVNFAQVPEILDFRRLPEREGYVDVPSSVLIVSTEVQGAYRAIEAGRYPDVNALAVASIVAVCNAAAGVEVPYVFGGYGATLLIPESRQRAVERALRGVHRLAESAFGLGLRASLVPMAGLREQGHVGRLVRYRLSQSTRVAMFQGSAFASADHFKDPTQDPKRSARHELDLGGESEVSFDGLECRWQPILSRRGKIVSLLVTARSPSEEGRAQTYRNLLRAFDTIADVKACHPVKKEALHLRDFWDAESIESKIRAQGVTGAAYESSRKSANKPSFVGRVLRRVGAKAAAADGVKYKSELVDNTDYRKFDETLRMVLDLSPEELYRFESRLAAEYRAGRLVYGLHQSSSAVLTSVVRSYPGDHVHFVDGADGGQALAAKQLQAQLGV